MSTMKERLAEDMAIPAKDLPVSITYRSKNAGTSGVNATTGVVTRNFDDTVVTDAYVREYSLRDVVASGGALETGDMRFAIKDADLSTDPKSTDQVVYDGTTFRVFKWSLEEDRNVWIVSGRKV